MVWVKHDYDEIPGTLVFDGKRAHDSLGVNQLLYSLNEEKNRDAFNNDPQAYVAGFELTDEQCTHLLNKDFKGLLNCGANIYYMAKAAVPQGVSVQDVGASFQGITTEEFIQKLFKQSENLTEKLEQAGGYWNG